ncbi:MAG: NUDIX domain-containing protein [Nitrospiraceae bacterium]|nr:NUDIX domain-containing protein [Nitrospiraceae bacterium]
MELGRFAEAEAAYLECLKERGDNEWNHRRAFEHRRLGQLHALMGQPTAARTAFDKALEIAERCGNARFARNARQDTVAFVDIPAFLRKERPEKVCLSTLAGQFDPKPSQLQPAFRVLWQEHQGYLPLLDPKTGETTDEVVRWDVAHSQGFWHPVVMVLMHDGEGNIALQERGERDSMGRLDTTVAGHQEVGETDVVCAIRETVEETGLLMSPSRLCRVDKPYNLVKRGSPDVDNDGHESGLCYRYHTNKINQERASLFVARVAEGEELQPMDVGTGRTHFEWVPLLDAVHRVEQDPDRFASSFKHLLSDEILTLLQESMM